MSCNWRWLLAVLALPALTGGCTTATADGCPQIRPVDDVFATYVYSSAERYRGGLTTEAQANAAIGETVTVSSDTFRLGDTEIEHPRYEIQCHPARLDEGEVPVDRWSVFYGRGMERDYVEVLSVFAGGETYPEFTFEIIDSQTLWRLYDGWLYVLKSGDT